MNYNTTEEEVHDGQLSFSYLLTPDTPPTCNNYTLNSYIKKIIETYSATAFERYENTASYLNSMLLMTKDQGYKQLDYNLMMQHRIKDDINFKNSYIRFAYENIPTPMPIFTTNTLDSQYHPFSSKGILNDRLDKETLIEQEYAFDKMVFDGYTKLENAHVDFYKSRLFREDKLTKEKKASIVAYEPHKTFVPHFHKLEIIDGNYIVDYIEQVLHNHQKHGLGRTEIAIFQNAFDQVKHLYTLRPGTDSKGNEILWINKKVYFKVLEQKSETEIQSISNYMTSYIEQQHIIEDKDRDIKKNPVKYNAFAYYLAALKDKFVPKKDGGKYRKIRRIRYAQLLISKAVYRSIMTKEFIAFLDSIGKAHKQNMYYHVTKLLKSQDLKVYRYHKINHETGEVEKDRVNYYRTEIESFVQIIDTMQNELWKFIESDGSRKLVMIETEPQIDLLKDSHVIERYNFEEPSEYKLFDTDVLQSV